MKTILVIEDEKCIREAICDILSLEEFEVINADNGEAGIELAISHLPNLIICDVMMPQLDGYEVLSQLQLNSLTQKIPFIFLTAKSSKNDFRLGMRLGADDYLTKPFTADELIEAVNIRLKKQASIQEYYVNQIQENKKKIDYLLRYDPLTKLLNQVALADEFNQIITANLVAKDELLPIICFALSQFNTFKVENGYNFSSFILKNIAEKLKKIVGLKAIIARVDSDEFVIIMQPVRYKKEIEDLAKNILDNLSDPLCFGDREIFITFNLGITLYPRDGIKLDKLLRNAKKAMEYSKQIAPNKYEFYAPALHENIQGYNNIFLEADLHYAIKREELEIHYQPLFNLQTQQVEGVEALLRWYHPKWGSIPPTKFIPLAEKAGLIESITKWVINKACFQTKTWHLSGLSNLSIAINFSASLFNQINPVILKEWLWQILREVELEPHYLCLELTENSFIDNNKAFQKLKVLKNIGTKIALDDFGIGYSSFEYLQKFPIDIIKIDKIFVGEVEKNSKNQAIVQAIISLAQKLNLNLIAEGVETQEELAFLIEHNCQQIQGFLFSPPLNALEVENFIKIINKPQP